MVVISWFINQLITGGLIYLSSPWAGLPSGYLLHSHGKPWPIEIDGLPNLCNSMVIFHGELLNNQMVMGMTPLLIYRNQWERDIYIIYGTGFV